MHRDIKPNNVFVTEEGEVKLLDFGVARLLDQASPQDTLEGAMSPGYAAPEQLTGEPITTATDVYALGVLLFELLTGVNPWGRDALPLAALVGRVLAGESTAGESACRAAGSTRRFPPRPFAATWMPLSPRRCAPSPRVATSRSHRCSATSIALSGPSRSRPEKAHAGTLRGDS